DGPARRHRHRPAPVYPSMAPAPPSASPRTTSGKGAARSLRSAGQIPAVIYGHAREPLSLAIPTRELEKLLERVSAESTVIELSLEGGGARVLVRGAPLLPSHEE